MKSTDNTPVQSGDGKTQATAYGLVIGTVPNRVIPTVKVNKISGQTTNVSYTFAVKSSGVTGVSSNADINTVTGAVASGKITDSGDIVITVTRAEVAGKLASATKDITIPILK